MPSLMMTRAISTKWITVSEIQKSKILHFIVDEEQKMMQLNRQSTASDSQNPASAITQRWEQDSRKDPEEEYFRLSCLALKIIYNEQDTDFIFTVSMINKKTRLNCCDYDRFLLENSTKSVRRIRFPSICGTSGSKKNSRKSMRCKNALWRLMPNLREYWSVLTMQFSKRDLIVPLAESTRVRK